MKNGVIGIIAGSLALCFSTCDRSGPTMPSSPVRTALQADGQRGPTAGELTVTSSRAAYFVGESETFTAVLTVPDGGPEAVTGGTWSSDTPGVATVNEAGRVTVVGEGWANIICAYGGHTASKGIWGRVDCRGVWSGTYSVRGCEIWKDFPDPQFCETHGGSGLPMEFALTQEGETLRGTIKLGALSTPFVAKPLLDGSLEMSGEVFSDPYTVEVAVGCEWTPAGPEFGMMLYYYRGDHLSGMAKLTCDVALVKTGDGR